MPVFTFSGKNSAGEKVAGERVAVNKQILATQLRREQINTPTIREKGKEFAMPTFGSGKVKTKDIAIFFRQFYCRRWRNPGECHAPTSQNF
jgi:type II secretory pathway component PulF